MPRTASSVPRPLDRSPATELAWKRTAGRVTTLTLEQLTRSMTRRGFEWLLPVVLSRTTDPLWPDPGASIERRLEVGIYDTTVRATLSMIVHKMVACSLLYPRLFVLSPNLRIERRERSATGRHLYEFTQLDFELRGARSADVHRLVDAVVVELTRALRRRASPELRRLGTLDCLARVRAPFPRYRWAQLLREYGDGWEESLTDRLDGPAWVKGIPREFYDFEDPASGEWDNYDLFLPRVGEVLSGARREWRYERLRAKMRRDGVDPSGYRTLLELARRRRLAPTAGAGLGVERVLRWATGARHIGLVQPFPRVPGSVQDL